MTRKNIHGQPIGDLLPVDWVSPPKPQRRVMEGSYVRIEPLDIDRHAGALYDANYIDRSGASWTYLNYGPFQDLQEYRAWLKMECLSDDPLFMSFIDLTSEQAIGLGSYLRINSFDGVIEVGHLHFSPRLQRTTLATEVMHLMIKNVFDLGYRRCEWKCDALNTPSRRAAERFGFKFEGIFRQVTHYKGRNRDTAWYSMIDKEWPQIRVAYETWLCPANFDKNGRQLNRLSEFMCQTVEL